MMFGFNSAGSRETGGDGNVLKLRSWLPKKMATESAFNRHFFLVVVAVVFTAMFSILGMVKEPGGYTWVYEFGVILSSVFLGFCMSNWWTAWDKGDDDRLSAEKIDDKLEEEIQWISENLRQIANSVSLLKEPKDGFLEATQFMLTAQLTSVRGRIERMALEIDRLGYNSGKFLNEKRLRFKEIQSRVRELMHLVPKESMLQGMDAAVQSLIEGLGRPDALPEPAAREETLVGKGSVVGTETTENDGGGDSVTPVGKDKKG